MAVCISIYARENAVLIVLERDAVAFSRFIHALLGLYM